MKLTQFTLELNVFLFVFFLAVALFIGFFFRRKQLIQLSDKVYDTEKELMRVNNEIFDHLQQNKKLEEEIKELKLKSSGAEHQEEKAKEIRLTKIG